jgi:hypothetical protein
MQEKLSNINKLNINNNNLIKDSQIVSLNKTLKSKTFSMSDLF